MTESDRLIARAAQIAAKEVPPRTKPSGEPAMWPDEREQVAPALKSALASLGVPETNVQLEVARIKHDWSRLNRLQAIDLTVCRRGSRQLWFAAELKIDNPDETLWDLFKLTAAFKLPGLEAALTGRADEGR